MAHRLDIGPGTPGTGLMHGRITFDDGTTADVYADERARVIAKAQEVVQRYRDQKETEPETLYLDEVGEIIRVPVEWSVKR